MALSLLQSCAVIRVGLLSSLMDLKVSMVAVVLSGMVHLLSSLTSLLHLLLSLLNSLLSILLSNFFKALMVTGQYVLYSDSLSCIRALQSLAPFSHYLISKIVSLLLSLPSHKVVIEWVPSHVGIPGNDTADHLARTTITHPHITNLPHFTPELRPVIMSSYYQLWSDHWTSLPLPLRSFKPSLMPTAFTDIPRSPRLVSPVWGLVCVFSLIAICFPTCFEWPASTVCVLWQLNTCSYCAPLMLDPAWSCRRFASGSAWLLMSPLCCLHHFLPSVCLVISESPLILAYSSLILALTSRCQGPLMSTHLNSLNYP